ncbi:flavodoxin family protein [Aquihabitans daechungensis]|uniref:flavodoxin family protein n=1 Tax=Aquihabitans daechungensis TaxID=1052257 RepID=UPI003B9FF287
MAALRAIALNCTLKPSPAESSTDVLISQIGDAFEDRGVELETIRIADLDIKPGVTDDEGAGDEWPSVRERILAADIVLLATPIWLGNPSSICRRVLERMDAFISETDDEGRQVTFGRVAVVATVGNEDGAHNVAAQAYQGMADVGFTIPAGAQAYWVGEAMGSVDYKDLKGKPDKVAQSIDSLTTNAAHLARLLKDQPYPPPGSCARPRCAPSSELVLAEGRYER